MICEKCYEVHYSDFLWENDDIDDENGIDYAVCPNCGNTLLLVDWIDLVRIKSIH